MYNKEQGCNKQRLPQFFQHHSKTDIDYIIKGFCIDIEVLKMIDLFGFSKHVMNNFYQYFRTIIYEQQKNELVKYFEKSPKIPQERIYMNAKVYLYLYEHKLFVSDKYLISNSNTDSLISSVIVEISSRVNLSNLLQSLKILSFI